MCFTYAMTRQNHSVIKQPNQGEKVTRALLASIQVKVSFVLSGPADAASAANSRKATYGFVSDLWQNWLPPTAVDSLKKGKKNSWALFHETLSICILRIWTILLWTTNIKVLWNRLLGHILQNSILCNNCPLTVIYGIFPICVYIYGLNLAVIKNLLFTDP